MMRERDDEEHEYHLLKTVHTFPVVMVFLAPLIKFGQKQKLLERVTTWTCLTARKPQVQFPLVLPQSPDKLKLNQIKSGLGQ